MDRVEGDLRANLPTGSSEAAVLAWFASQGLTPTELVRPPDRRRVGWGADIPSYGLFGLKRATICVYVYFDADGNVERYSLQRVAPSV